MQSTIVCTWLVSVGDIQRSFVVASTNMYTGNLKLFVSVEITVFLISLNITATTSELLFVGSLQLIGHDNYAYVVSVKYLNKKLAEFKKYFQVY